MNEQLMTFVKKVIKGLIQSPQDTLAQLQQYEKQAPGATELIILIILEMANSGDKEAVQAMQAIGEEVNAVLAHRQGAKLEYLKALKGECPEGYETAYMKAGGRVCPVCQKKKAKKAENGIEMSKCGGKAKKTGAISKAMEGIKLKMAGGGGVPPIDSALAGAPTADTPKVPYSPYYTPESLRVRPSRLSEEVLRFGDWINRTFPDKAARNSMRRWVAENGLPKPLPMGEQAEYNPPYNAKTMGSVYKLYLDENKLLKNHNHHLGTESN